MIELWFAILVFILAMYAVLDGFDFGVGIWYLFNKDEKKKEKLLHSIAPFWDANEVWLIAGGGLLFMAFPLVYSSSFSGFYLPLIMILWLLMLRGVSLELRHRIEFPLVQQFLDKSFGIASLLLTFFFAVALGNIIRGVNLGDVENGISLLEKEYFFAALWTDFTPFGSVGIIDYFTTYIGLVGVVIILFHSANWIILKLDHSFRDDLNKRYTKLWYLSLLLIFLSYFLIAFVRPENFSNFLETPVLFLVPILSFFSLILSGIFQKQKKELAAFIASSSFILLKFATTAIALFPNLLVSSNKINPSLSIYNSHSGDYSLGVSIYWFILGILLISTYFFYVHWIYKGKLND